MWHDSPFPWPPNFFFFFFCHCPLRGVSPSSFLVSARTLFLMPWGSSACCLLLSVIPHFAHHLSLLLFLIFWRILISQIWPWPATPSATAQMDTHLFAVTLQDVSLCVGAALPPFCPWHPSPWTSKGSGLVLSPSCFQTSLCFPIAGGLVLSVCCRCGLLTFVWSSN